MKRPIFYNDQFHTTTASGATVVAIEGAGGTLTPLTVRSDPANPASAPIPLSLAMMRDRTNPYYAALRRRARPR